MTEIDNRTLLQRLQDEPDPLPARSVERIMREQNEQIEALKKALADATQWRLISDEPDEPMMVIYYCERLMFHDSDGTPISPKLGPGRDEAFELGFFNGDVFCYLGTGHAIFEWSGDYESDNKPTKWVPLTAAPNAASIVKGVPADAALKEEGE